MTVELFFAAGATLGEGPRWNSATSELHWVDIERGEIHRVGVDGQNHHVLAVGESVGAVVPRRSGGWLAALRDGVALLDAAGKREWFVAVDERVGHRTNDGLCDTAGRFWVGTLDEEHGEYSDALYSVSPSREITRVVENVGLSNGVGWSPDDALMYRVDSARGIVFRCAFDQVAGTRGDDEEFARIPSSEGEPDGLTVDAEGGVWVALWDGWQLRRYTPAGSLDRVLEVPVSRPTSCVFGGHDLSTMFITSASTGLSDAERSEQPWAGHVLTCTPGVIGLPTNLFPS